MATVYPAILGTRQLDVLGINTPEVATIGNTGANAFIRLYDLNAPAQRPYLFGLSNTSFFVLRGDNPSSTQFNIGTATSIPGVQLQVTGHMTTSNLGIGTTNPLASLHVHNGTILSTTSTGSTSFYADSTKVGIGVVPTDPTIALRVEGNTSISGILSVGRLVELAGSTKFRMVDLYLGDANNSKTIRTNDPVISNRVLFTFSIDKGSYILNANIPYANLSSLMPLDTINWAIIGLYRTNVAGFTSSSTPLYTCPLIAIGGGSTDFDSAYFTTALDVNDSTNVDYVVAVTGLGHQLQFGGVNVPVPKLYLIPTTGLGVDDGVDVRQAFQLAPIRKSFVATSGQKNFTLDAVPGVYSVSSCNVDVFVNGIKSSNVSITQNVNNDQTTFAVSLQNSVALNTPVEVSVLPQAVGTNFYSSGYLYQTIANFSAPFQNVQGGGIRSPSRMIVDGDLIVRGQVYSSCNTTTFQSGVQWDGKLADISSNVLGTLNLIDGCITTSKLQPSCVTTNNIANLSITSDKIANFAVSNANIANNSITESKLNLGAGFVGVGVTNPRAHWHVNGAIMTNTGFSVANNTNPYISYDFNQIDTSSIVSFQTSNVDLMVPATIRLDARMLGSVSSVVNSWGNVFVQATPLYQPTFYTSGGYQNGSYLQFKIKSFTGASAYTFNMQTINGITAAALVRFDNGIGSDFTGDTIFTLRDQSTPTRYITLQRNTTISTTLDFTVSVPTGSYTLSIPNVIVVSEWALFMVIMDLDTNITVYKNGKVIGNGTSGYPNPAFQFNQTYNLTPFLCTNLAGNARGNISYSAFHVYSKILSAGDVATITNYMLQGWAGFSRSVVMNDMQLNPTPYAALDVATPPVANLDINANLRIHVLPEAPLWVIDAFSSKSIFMNSDATLPTFNTNTGYITCASGKFIELGPRVYNVKSCGFTFVAKFSVSGTTAGDVILYVGVNPSTSPGTDNYIQIRRKTSVSQNFVLDMQFNGASPYIIDFSQQFIEGLVYTITVLIDYDVVIGLWINGIQDTTVSTILPVFNDIIDTTFKYTRVGSFAGTLYCAALYNRPLSDIEIVQAHNTLMSDTPHAGLDVGSRTGRSALMVSRDGLVPSITLGNDNTISGLMAHISFDNHLHDTSLRTTFGAPVARGIIQFNGRGRIGSSLVLNNLTGNVAQQHGVSYPAITPFQIGGESISLWFKPYETGGNNAYLFSLADTSQSLVEMYLTPSGARSLVNMSIRNSTGSLATLTASSFPVSSNEWNHVATSIQNDALVNLYVNGSLAVTNNVSSLSSCNVTQLVLGSSNNTMFPFAGELDDLRLYSKVLSPIEVQQLTSSTYRNNIEVRNEDNTRNVVSASSTGLQVSTPMQLSTSTSIQTVVTNSDTLENTLQINCANYEVRDMTNTHANIFLYGSATLSSLVPFETFQDEGSVYFPGVKGSYLMFHYPTPSTDFSISNGLTVECWVNYQSYQGAFYSLGSLSAPTLCGLMDPMTNLFGFSLGANNNGNLTFSYSGIIDPLIGTGVIPVNTWNHIAVSITSAGTARLFLNGNLVGTQTITFPTQSITSFVVGSFNENTVNAYVSNVRVVKSTLYTAQFTPQIVPLLTNPNTTLLVRCMRITTTPLSLTSKGTLSINGTVNAPNMNMFRNKIINGAMNIDQRYNGSSYPTITGGSTINYTLDRWMIHSVITGQYKFERKTLGTQETPYRYGFTNSLLISILTGFTGNGYFIAIQQRIESHMFSDLYWNGNGNGFHATLSFWFKAKQAGQYQTCIRRSLQSCLQSFNYSTSDTWQYVVITFPPPPGTGAGWNINNTTDHIQLSIGSIVTANVGKGNGWTLIGSAPEMTPDFTRWVETAGNYIQFTGVQFEKGQQPTPFEFRPESTELQLCKRYFESSGGLVSLFPGCETSANVSTITLGTTVPIAAKRNSSYTITTYDRNNALNKTSAKFAGTTVKDNITCTTSVLTPSSFYAGLTMSDYNTAAATTGYLAFIRGNLIFKWEVSSEL